MNKVEKDFSEVMSLYKISSASRSSEDTLILLHKIQNIVSTSICPPAEKQYLQKLAYEIYKPYSFARSEDFVINRLFLQIFGDDVQEAYFRINPQGSPMGENHAKAVIEKAKSYGYLGEDPLEAAVYTLSLLEEVSSLSDKEGKALFGEDFKRENIEAFLANLDVTEFPAVAFSEGRPCHKLAAFALQKYKEETGGSQPILILGVGIKTQVAAAIIKRAIITGDASLLKSALKIFTPFTGDFKRLLLGGEDWGHLMFSSKASEVDRTRITTLLTGKEGFLSDRRSSILKRAIQDGDLSVVNGCLGAIALLDQGDKAVLKGTDWQSLIIDSKVEMTDRVNISFALHESGFLFTKEHLLKLLQNKESPALFFNLYAKGNIEYRLHLTVQEKALLLNQAVENRQIDVVRFFVEDSDLGYSKSFKLFVFMAPDFFLKYILQNAFLESSLTTNRNYTILAQRDGSANEVGVKVILQKSSESSDLETLKQLFQNPVADPMEKAYVKLIASKIYERCNQRFQDRSFLDFDAKDRLEEIERAYRQINPSGLPGNTGVIQAVWDKEVCMRYLREQLARAQEYGYVGDDPIEGIAHIEALVAEIDSLSTDAKKCFSTKRNALEILDDPDFNVDGYHEFIDELRFRIGADSSVVFTGTTYNALSKFVLQKVRKGSALKEIQNTAKGNLELFVLKSYFVQAAGENQVETIELFLKMGALVYWQSEALEVAIEKGNLKLVELLATEDVLRYDINAPWILFAAMSFKGDPAVKLAILKKLFEIGWKFCEEDKLEILRLEDSSPEVVGLLADKLIEGIPDEPIGKKRLEIGQMILHTENPNLKGALQEKRSAFLKKVSWAPDVVERSKRK